MSKKDSRSKFLSLVLRHKPEAINITLDSNGWASVKELVNNISKQDTDFNMQILEYIVKTDKKGRYSFNEGKTLIRANQGHSIDVDVEFKESTPPDVLYHGTATRFIESIIKNGILSESRLYVHLSDNYNTATEVGKRHGNPIVLTVDAKAMVSDGFNFYLSNNGVWLTKYVPCKYLNCLKKER